MNRVEPAAVETKGRNDSVFKWHPKRIPYSLMLVSADYKGKEAATAS